MTVLVSVASVVVAGFALKAAGKSLSLAQATADRQLRPWIGIEATPEGGPRAPNQGWEIDVAIVFHNYGPSPAVRVAMAMELTGHARNNSVLPPTIESTCAAVEQIRDNASQGAGMYAEHVADVFPAQPITVSRTVGANWNGLHDGAYLTLVGCAQYGMAGSNDLTGTTPFAFDLFMAETCDQFTRSFVFIRRAGRIDLYRLFSPLSRSSGGPDVNPSFERVLCLTPTGGLGISIE